MQCTSVWDSHKDPQNPNGEIFKRIGRYLNETGKLGIYTRPSDSNFKVWDDSDFSGNWFPEETKDDSDMARCCSVFFISY